ncbi:transcription antitermination factor NusB [Mucilaginibacter sp. PPCGB 2223]|uniref:transcription antitermination protein NusB n=1 Tax=Mucilaginibacter sp. PPCGB 2223 TaxID=1886027 RepID=UPI0008260F1F|nr:transcription antitermination protein NusB [Mucilaginibacter sp. PPCGB 2223]OCX53099.1 transcription antitermination factor NusB [Mucilaginibacter sp. PPCGB 2223]
MLNRRHLRVKVLQSLYAYHQSEKKDIKQHEKGLIQSVDKVHEMYIWMLSLMNEVAQYADVDATTLANKFLPTEEDLKPNLKILGNTFINSLNKNKEYLAAIKKYKVSWTFDPELTKSLFASLKTSPEYKAYLEKTDDTVHSDKDIMKHIFKKVILKSLLAEQFFEDKFIYWPVDKDVLQAMIAKTFKNFAYEEPEKNKLAEVVVNWEEDEEFITRLFQYSIRYDDDFQVMISNKTQNWEPERIAMMDTLLMKMALAEFMYFPSIPVKVTINEYLEISKEFSTPKSNSFINGILDKILAELKSEGKIKKTGRGLIE